MTIVAKFAGHCSACGGRIAVGDRIDWKKGSGSKHETCPRGDRAKTLARKPRAPRAPSGPRKPRYPSEAPEAGAHQISGRRDDRRDNRFDVGQVVHLPKVSVDGGGPDGKYYVILAHTLSAPCEDNGQYDWTEYAWVRAATPAEAEELAAQIRKVAAPKTVAAFVVATVKTGDRAGDEAASTVRNAVPRDALTWTSPKGDLHWVAIVGENVVGYHGGSYDDYRAVAWTVPATELLCLAIRALASGSADELAVAADAVEAAK